MSEQDTQSTNEAQKTVIAFIAGLIIGGLLAFIFGGTTAETPAVDDEMDTVAEVDEDDEEDSDLPAASDGGDITSDTTPANTIQTGDGSVRVSDQDAGATVAISNATFPTDEGWIGVREYADGEVGSILGVARYSKDQGLLPTQVRLLRSTTAGNEYAIVFFTENGDRSFNAATDTQIGDEVEIFTAE